MLNRHRLAAAAAVIGALAISAPVASAQTTMLVLPGIANYGPTGPMGPLGPHGPLGSSAQAPTGLDAWNLGPSGPLGPGGPLDPGH